MEITVNGEKRTLDKPTTIVGLLHELGIDPRSVVVEKNLEIVPHQSMAETSIEEGDSLEIVRIVGGG